MESCNALATSELYDAGGAGTWTATGSMTQARTQHTATLLSTGKVLVTGGFSLNFLGNPMTVAELYDPATGTWTPTGSMGTGGDILGTAELYDPATGTWSATGSLHDARSSQKATLLSDGKVLVTGGTTTGNTILGTAELYDPATGTWSATGSLHDARSSHTA